VWCAVALACRHIERLKTTQHKPVLITHLDRDPPKAKQLHVPSIIDQFNICAHLPRALLEKRENRLFHSELPSE
jgi:hypothetical protein